MQVKFEVAMFFLWHFLPFSQDELEAIIPGRASIVFVILLPL
jgi:hypothetical protein